jgi:hypothetical protein
MAEKLNGPGFGARMALAGVSLPPSFDALKERLDQVAATSQEVQDSLRELLSYCTNESVDPHTLDGGTAYADVAARLRDLLDGE